MQCAGRKLVGNRVNNNQQGCLASLGPQTGEHSAESLIPRVKSCAPLWRRVGRDKHGDGLSSSGARGRGGGGVSEPTVRQGWANFALDLVPKNLIFVALKKLFYKQSVLHLPFQQGNLERTAIFY